jgi:SAM-dependent methyltransferase
MTEPKIHRQEPRSNLPQADSGVEALSRIRTLLGDKAAERFVPLWRQWVRSGFISGERFNLIGDKMLAACIKLGGLKPWDSVLEVGCGIGRNTFPLLGHLAPSAAYEGFDVTTSGIRWLRRYVTPKFAHFRFQQAAKIYSGLYNPQAGGDAATFKFPYPKGSFDLALAVSVFTHMAPLAVSHYLSEIARTLKPHGRLLCTCYLMDDSALAMVRAGRSAIGFPNDFGSYRLQKVSMPEFAVAFDKNYFLQSANEAGLNLKGKIKPGSWRNEGGHTGQDLVVLEKRLEKNASCNSSAVPTRAGAG